LKKKLLIIGAIIALLAIICGSIGLYMFYKPTKNFSKSKVDVTLTSTGLFNEFLKDQNLANSKYVSTDKTIEITGKITEIKKNDDGTILIIFDVGNTDGDVSCTLANEETPKAAKYHAGSIIKIKGQCTGYQELISKEVIMIRCGIVELFY